MGGIASCVDRMGIRLSTQQKEIYVQVVGVLREGSSLREGVGGFSKGLVKKFVRRIFFHFPTVSVRSVRDKDFWRGVGLALTEGTRRGDPSVKDGYMKLFVLIWEVVKDNGTGEIRRDDKRDSSAKSPVFPRALSPPRSPTPGSPRLGGQEGADCPQQAQGADHLQQSQGCRLLPGSPRSLQYPHSGSAGHTVGDTCPSPSPALSHPVINPSCLQGVSIPPNPFLDPPNPFLSPSGEVPQNGCSFAPTLPSQDGHHHMAGASPPLNPFLPLTPHPTSPFPDPSSSFAVMSQAPPKTYYAVPPTAPPLEAASPTPTPFPVMSIAPPSTYVTSAQGSTPQDPACHLPVSHTLPSGSHGDMGTGGAGPGKQKANDNNALPFLAPVTYNERGQHPRWEPLLYDCIRELCKTK